MYRWMKLTDTTTKDLAREVTGDTLLVPLEPGFYELVVSAGGVQQRIREPRLAVTVPFELKLGSPRSTGIASVGIRQSGRMMKVLNARRVLPRCGSRKWIFRSRRISRFATSSRTISRRCGRGTPPSIHGCSTRLSWSCASSHAAAATTVWSSRWKCTAAFAHLITTPASKVRHATADICTATRPT